MLEIFEYGFMQRAFVAGITISVVAPMVGMFLVSRKLSLVTDSLAHLALVGVAVGVLLGFSPLPFVMLVTGAAGMLIVALRGMERMPGDAVLGLLMPTGLAVAMVLVQMGNIPFATMTNFLFGSITTVTASETLTIIAVAVGLSLIVWRSYRMLLFSSFDPEAAKLSGIPIRLAEITLMLMTAMIVAVGLRLVGALLLSAIVVIPVLSASKLANSFKNTLVLAVCLAVLATVVGLFGAYYLSMPAGPMIVLVHVGFFLVSLLVYYRR